MAHDQGNVQFNDFTGGIEEIKEKLLALSNHEAALCRKAFSIIENLKSSTELANKLYHDTQTKQEVMRNNVSTFTALKTGI